MALSITRGSDGALWFTKASGGIGRITTAGSISDFPFNSKKGASLGIVTGSDGALWFTEPKANKIGRITTAGIISEFLLPAQSYTTAIAAGPKDTLWFTACNNIVRIRP